jgi:hypothetical protein
MRPIESHTEVTRREKTVLRQEIADDVMDRYLREKDPVETSDEEFQRQIYVAKEETMRDYQKIQQRWEDMRIQAAIAEKERLLAEKEYKKLDYGTEIKYWSIIIGGAAIAVAVIAIMKGYRYI